MEGKGLRLYNWKKLKTGTLMICFSISYQSEFVIVIEMKYGFIASILVANKLCQMDGD